MHECTRVHNLCVCVCVCVHVCAHSSVFSRDPCREEENTLYLPLLPLSLSLLPDLLQCVCVCVCVCVCLVLPEGCSGDVMDHLNEGQGV